MPCRLRNRVLQTGSGGSSDLLPDPSDTQTWQTVVRVCTCRQTGRPTGAEASSSGGGRRYSVLLTAQVASATEPTSEAASFASRLLSLSFSSLVPLSLCLSAYLTWRHGNSNSNSNSNNSSKSMRTLVEISRHFETGRQAKRGQSSVVFRSAPSRMTTCRHHKPGQKGSAANPQLRYRV
ncbi:unnamed protein product [Protopolystoma xenopodis]|uniref:Uncharacterized protein n=1 Tax=Protopolystoma xenopodis TaxID=117903 RepID=A0A448X3B7_9PLAT|nr:unnamed protein product [Protopolystoma xenopodis]